MGDVDEAIVRSFAPLRRLRRLSDALPAPAVVAVGLSPADFQLACGESRAVRAGASGRPWYVVPGRGVLGVYDDRGAGSVARTAWAVVGRCVGTSFRGRGALEVHGLLPDGATEARVVRQNAESVEFIARQNVFDVLVTGNDVSELPEVVEFVRDGKRHRVDVPGANKDMFNCNTPGTRFF